MNMKCETVLTNMTVSCKTKTKYMVSMGTYKTKVISVLGLVVLLLLFSFTKQGWNLLMTSTDNSYLLFWSCWVFCF